jgi:hypothetical protein
MLNDGVIASETLTIDDLILEGEKLKLKTEQFLLEVKYGTVNMNASILVKNRCL